MLLKKINIILFPVLVIFTAYLLFINTDLLARSIIPDRELPFGNFIIWLLLTLYALLMLQLFPQKETNAVKTVMVKILQLNILLALFWGLIAFLLSGNWAFSFKNAPLEFKSWLILTALVLLTPLVVYAVLFLRNLWKRLKP